MTRAAAIAALVALVLAAGAQSAPVAWRPSAGHVQTPIWPGPPPNALPRPKPETATADWQGVENVSRPTMTVYAPKGRNTGVAAIVFP
ncbi:MAG TPA: hypothetical protein VFN88_09905, partial [Caulobacteraceae bacterium]|nr:hypothetical protein [Caulobacteraceae bacterium]